MAVCLDLAAGPDPNPFAWEEIEKEPKAPKICLARAHRTTEYEILHTGGFLRLCTERGRIYWMAQNEHDHRTPDWKIHFSIRPSHIPRAWDVLTGLFVAHACDFGMKAVAEEAWAAWPEKQRGRELTVYIFQHDSVAYPNGGPMMGLCSEGEEHRFWLGPEFERDAAFWRRLVADAEAALAIAGVVSHGGTARGDLPLGGPYASLRNEAFIPSREEKGCFMYPPNYAGWNAAGHQCPLKLTRAALWRAEASRTLTRLQCTRRRRRE